MLSLIDRGDAWARSSIMEEFMRRSRHIDSEPNVFPDKARRLKDRRVRQLGEPIATTGAEVFDAEAFTGTLLGAAATKDSALLALRRKDGTAFFSGQAGLGRAPIMAQVGLHRSTMAQHRLEAGTA